MGDSRRLTVAAGMVSRALDVGVRNGLDRDRLLEQSGIDGEVLQDRDNRVPMEAVIRLWQILTLRLPDKVLALEWLAAFQPADIGVLGYMVAQVANVGEALEAVVRYVHLINQGTTATLERSPSMARMTYSFIPPLLASQHVPETALAVQVSFLRAMVEPGFIPSGVYLPHRRTQRTPALEQFFGTKVSHGQPQVALEFPVAFLEQPIAGADPTLAGYLRRQADQMLARMDASRSVSQETARRLAERLSSGEPSQASIAKQMGMSERTLQRRLADEGTTFNKLLEEARRSVALGYLADRNLAAYEVSFLLGYAEPATFFRAFKRWTGQTPQQYRASMA
jgi:AraC-like DNA-binding protein